VRRPDDVRLRRPAGLRPKAALSLARALSKFGVSSRREAERWIAAGRVRVNGSVATDPSRWIDPAADRVLVDGRRVGDDTPRVVLAFHKPKGVVTTRTDPGGRPTVYDVLGDAPRLSPAGAPAPPGWVFPVGRLDRDSSGLLILTNDHRLGERLTAPEHHVPRTYHARVRGVPEEEALRALREGLPLDDGALTRPARVRVLGSRAGTTWLEIVLTEGKNRQVRRMGAAVGHEVEELVRVRVGELSLEDLGLAPGEWRELDGDGVARLLRGGASGAGPRPGRAPGRGRV
jgi:23S rRNA pseudouridine2605 synthase